MWHLRLPTTAVAPIVVDTVDDAAAAVAVATHCWLLIAVCLWWTLTYYGTQHDTAKLFLLFTTLFLPSISFCLFNDTSISFFSKLWLLSALMRLLLIKAVGKVCGGRKKGLNMHNCCKKREIGTCNYLFLLLLQNKSERCCKIICEHRLYYLWLLN